MHRLVASKGSLPLQFVTPFSHAILLEDRLNGLVILQHLFRSPNDCLSHFFFGFLCRFNDDFRNMLTFKC